MSDRAQVEYLSRIEPNTAGLTEDELLDLGAINHTVITDSPTRLLVSLS